MKKVHFSILMAIVCCLFVMISCGGGGGGGETQVVTVLPTPDISVSETNVAFGGVVRNNSGVQTITIQSTVYMNPIVD